MAGQFDVRAWSAPIRESFTSADTRTNIQTAKKALAALGVGHLEMLDEAGDIEGLMTTTDTLLNESRDVLDKSLQSWTSSTGVSSATTYDDYVRNFINSRMTSVPLKEAPSSTAAPALKEGAPVQTKSKGASRVGGEGVVGADTTPVIQRTNWYSHVTLAALLSFSFDGKADVDVVASQASLGTQLSGLDRGARKPLNLVLNVRKGDNKFAQGELNHFVALSVKFDEVSPHKPIVFFSDPSGYPMSDEIREAITVQLGGDVEIRDLVSKTINNDHDCGPASVEILCYMHNSSVIALRGQGLSHMTHFDGDQVRSRQAVSIGLGPLVGTKRDKLDSSPARSSGDYQSATLPEGPSPTVWAANSELKDAFNAPSYVSNPRDEYFWTIYHADSDTYSVYQCIPSGDGSFGYTQVADKQRREDVQDYFGFELPSLIFPEDSVWHRPVGDFESSKIPTIFKDATTMVKFTGKRQFLAAIAGLSYSDDHTTLLDAVKAWNQLNADNFAVQVSVKDAGVDMSKVSGAGKGSSRVEGGPGMDSLSGSPKVRGFSVNGTEMECKLLSDAGGYHAVYEVPEGVSGGPWVVKVPKDPSDRGTSSVASGMAQYHRLSKSALLTLPKMLNASTAAKDGFYVLKRVPDMCDPSHWSGDVALGGLSSVQMAHLHQIRAVLMEIIKSGPQVAPDFRPDNIGFDGDKLIFLDFTEQAEPMDQSSTEFARMMKRVVENFSGKVIEKKSDVNDVVYDYLTENFPAGLLERMTSVEAYKFD